ncbi:MAG: multicopper oxidase domain-containing protein [Bacteroidia bacterium]
MIIKNLTLSFITLSLIASNFALSQNPLAIPDTISGRIINLTLQNGTKQFYPGTITQTMGVNGNILGPTLMLNKNQQVTINVTNNLNETTTIHWHGMHVAPENDGGPHIVIPPSTTWSPSFEVLDHASTHWYHPHLHEKTHYHVQKGIAGFVIVRDNEEAKINLPRTYGVDDFPLAIQTKSFTSNNQIVTDHVSSDTSLMVNATRNPFLNVPAQVVRFRLLNGSSERVYNIGLSNNASFAVIGSDGGLLTAPVNLTRLLIAPGERYEILVNFSEMQGQTIHLRNYGTGISNAIYGAAQPGMGAGQQIPGYTSNLLNGRDFNILQLNIVTPTANAVTSIPGSLISHNPWAENSANITRNLTFTSMTMGQGAINGPFVINNAHFDLNVINYRVPFNNVEIWELRNQTPIAHPFHIHNVPFYVLSVNGQVPAIHQRGRKDVVLVPGGNGVVRFITKFEDFYNDTLPYMYHCHMLTHEDDGMMGQYVVTSPCNLIAAQPQNVSTIQGLTAEFNIIPKTTTGVNFKWQSNIGFGFQDLQNAGQYSGVNTSKLTVSNIAISNNQQQFRCIVSNSTCEEISDTAILFLLTQSVKNIEDKVSFIIYPNPASNKFAIENLPLNSSIEIFDAQGKQVIIINSYKGQSIDISDIKNGIYAVKCSLPNGYTFQTKILVSKY